MIIRQISMVHCCLREIIEQFFILEESPVTLRSAVYMYDYSYVGCI